MELSRRSFLQLGAAAAALPGLKLAAAPKTPQPYFGVHPFIEANPNAVFIRRTKVADKMDSAATLREGLELARRIFVPMDRPGIPISHRVILKPNATGVYDHRRAPAENWGVGTDPHFYEGMVRGLQEIGLKKFHFIESTGYDIWNIRGFNGINERLGIEWNESQRRPQHLRDGYETTWATVPDPVIFKRIPHYAPVGEPDTWLLDISKWKAHSMCLTQSVKNLQGLVAHPFTNFCAGWQGVLKREDVVAAEVHPRVEQAVNRYFDDHRRRGFSRYDAVGGRRGGTVITPMAQEIWAHKTCDNVSTLKVGLAMIEGICGRDGDGFNIGQDYLSNIVMFGKDPFQVDVVGLYLGGHEPGNVNLYRIAKERGLTKNFNPWEVPIFEWTDQGPVPAKLAAFPRTPLRTIYLTRQDEPNMHLVNDPFDYAKIKV